MTGELDSDLACRQKGPTGPIFQAKKAQTGNRRLGPLTLKKMTMPLLVPSITSKIDLFNTGTNLMRFFFHFEKFET